MNDLSKPARRPVELPEDVKAELLRRRDAVDAGEPTIEAAEAIERVRIRARSKPSPR
jgi:hypothetical protein